MKKVVILWLDAFSDRFLSVRLCPFLSDLSKSCSISATVSPLFAYMGIDYSIETGISTNNLGVWNEHVFTGFAPVKDFKTSIFKIFIKFADRITFSDNLNKACRFGLSKLFRIKYGIPHLIPPALLDYYPIVDYHFEQQNLFNLLEQNGVNIIKKEPKFNRSEASVLLKVPELLTHYDIVLLKLNSLDRLGHLHGPLSSQVEKRIQYLDGLIKSLFDKLSEDISIIVMSDHGMVPVHTTHDLIGILKDNGHILGKDYFAFIGATYTSFWFKDHKTKDAIEQNLNMLEFGVVLTPEQKVQLGLNNLEYKYGETFFINKEGTASFPEFYHIRKPPAGMHGYAFCKYDSPIFLLRDKPDNHLETRINFVDILPTLLKLYNVAPPLNLDGKAIY
jgi:hypothetical protein